MSWKYGGNDTFSLDRIDSSKGYYRENVVLCCNIVNLMKSDMPINEFLGYINEISARTQLILERLSIKKNAHF